MRSRAAVYYIVFIIYKKSKIKSDPNLSMTRASGKFDARREPPNVDRD